MSQHTFEALKRFNDITLEATSTLADCNFYGSTCLASGVTCLKGGAFSTADSAIVSGDGADGSFAAAANTAAW
jgi:hypothetical protein